MNYEELLLAEQEAQRNAFLPPERVGSITVPLSEREQELTEKLDETWRVFDAIGDSPRAIAEGIGITVDLLGNVVGLGTGDMDNALTRLGRGAREYWAERADSRYKEAAKGFQEATNTGSVLGDIAGGGGYLAKNPGFGVTELLKNLPVMAPAGAVGVGAGKLALASGFKKIAKSGLTGAAEKAAKAAAVAGASATGLTAAKIAGPVMEAADPAQDTYDRVMAMDEKRLAKNDVYQALLKNAFTEAGARKWIATNLSRVTWIEAFPVSLATTFFIPGGDVMERIFTGKGLPAGKFLQKIMNLGGTAVAEGFEEGSGQAISNLNLQSLDSSQSIAEGVGGQSILAAAAGAGTAVVPTMMAGSETKPDTRRSGTQLGNLPVSSEVAAERLKELETLATQAGDETAAKELRKQAEEVVKPPKKAWLADYTGPVDKDVMKQWRKRTVPLLQGESARLRDAAVQIETDNPTMAQAWRDNADAIDYVVKSKTEPTAQAQPAEAVQPAATEPTPPTTPPIPQTGGIPQAGGVHPTEIPAGAETPIQPPSPTAKEPAPAGTVEAAPAAVVAPKPVKAKPIPKVKRTRKEAAKARQLIKDTDELLTAISKAGGLNTDLARKEGIDEPDLKRKVGVRRLFTSKGESFDGMAKILKDYGYPVVDEQGDYYGNILLDRVARALRGEKIHTTKGVEARGEDASEKFLEEDERRYEEERLEDERERAAERAAIQAEEAPEGEILAPYTAEDLAEREAQKEEAADRRANDERREAADEARKGFVLEGSTQPADQAAARGQLDVVEESRKPKQPEEATRETEAKEQAPALLKYSIETIENSEGKPIAYEVREGDKRLDVFSTMAEAKVMQRMYKAEAEDKVAREKRARKAQPEEPKFAFADVPQKFLTTHKVPVDILEVDEATGKDRVTEQRVTAKEALHDIETEIGLMKALRECLNR